MKNLFRLSNNRKTTGSGKLIPLELVHRLITGQAGKGILKTKTENVRNATDKQGRDTEKSKLNVIEFNSICKGDRNKDNVTSTTGYIVMDIDHLETYMVEPLRDSLFENPKLGVVLSFISPSGCGVKALVRVNGINVDNFDEWWQCVAYFIHKNFDVDCDSNAKDIVRLTYMCYDPDAKLSTNTNKAFAYTLEEWKRVVEQDCKNGKSQNKIADLKPKSSYKGYVPTSADKPQLQKFMKLFAAYCVKHSICLWDSNNTYNHWLGFGAQCKDLFDGSQDGLDVWDDCSKFASNYDQKVIYDKYDNNKLPEGTFHSIIGTIINAARLQGRKKSIEAVITNLKIKSGII